MRTHEPINTVLNNSDLRREPSVIAKTLSLLLMFAFLMSGCVAPKVQMYSGSAIESKNYAVIKTSEEDSSSGQRLGIVSVDGDITVGFFRYMFITAGKFASEVQVLPGKHDIGVTWERGGNHTTGVYCLIANANKSYTVKSTQKGYNIFLWFEDDETGGVVGGIKGGCEKTGPEPPAGADSFRYPQRN